MLTTESIHPWIFPFEITLVVGCPLNKSAEDIHNQCYVFHIIGFKPRILFQLILESFREFRIHNIFQVPLFNIIQY